MNFESIQKEHIFSFMKDFDYIRAAGTPGETQAAEMICKRIRELGLEPVTQPFSFETTLVTDVKVQVTKPYVKEYPAKAYTNCAITSADGICLPLCFVENADPISLSHTRQKAALISGLVRKEQYEKLVNAGAAAFISITGTPIEKDEDRIPADVRVRFNANECSSAAGTSVSAIPGVNIHCLDAQEMVELGALEVKIVVQYEHVKRQSQNICVTIPGTELPQQIIALSAHYDSVPAGKGAYDNMAGAAIVWETCCYFAAHPPKHTLRFLFFGAEEQGLLGSQAYLLQHKKELRNILLNLNVDLAGQFAGGTVIGVTADHSLCDTLYALLWKYDIGAEIRHAVWSSDSNTFAYHGVPALSLDRDGFGMHTRYDTIDLISPWSLARDARMLAALAEGIDELSTMPFARDIPADMQEKLEEYFKNTRNNHYENQH